jgi:hypothetical protein
MEKFKKCSACGAVIAATTPHEEFHRLLDGLSRES